MRNTFLIRDFCKTKSGSTPSRKNLSYYEGNIPWVKSGELDYNVVETTEETITEEAVKEYHLEVHQKGTLLIALYGATVGKLAFLGTPAATNQAVCALIPNEKLDKKFLYWYLFCNRQSLINKSIGGAQLNISQGILKNFEIPVPAIEEQHRILAKIEELFSELDNGVANLEKTRAQLQTYRQSVLKHAFEGALTEKWRTIHAPKSQSLTSTHQQANLAAEPQPTYQANAAPLPDIEEITQETLENLPGPELLQYIKAERQRQYEKEYKAWQQQAAQAKEKGQKKPAKPKQPKEMPSLTNEELNQLPELSEGWCWVKLGDLLTSNMIGIVRNSGQQNREGKGVPYVKMNNIREDGKMDFNDLVYVEVDKNELDKYQLKEDDILFNTRNSFELVGKTGIMPPTKGQDYVFNNNLMRMRLALVDPKFIWYQMNAPFVKNNIGLDKKATTNICALYSKDIFPIKLKIPPLKEQKQIVREIESRLSVADNMESAVDQSLQQAQSLRQSILKKAFEGELVPSEEQVEAEKV